VEGCASFAWFWKRKRGDARTMVAPSSAVGSAGAGGAGGSTVGSFVDTELSVTLAAT